MGSFWMCRMTPAQLKCSKCCREQDAPDEILKVEEPEPGGAYQPHLDGESHHLPASHVGSQTFDAADKEVHAFLQREYEVERKEHVVEDDCKWVTDEDGHVVRCKAKKHLPGEQKHEGIQESAGRRYEAGDAFEAGISTT
eukprot:gnl/MRDRNA2_/MRDRNA2_57056_c0_seq1.p1 gnl/MRDRNA2_/MRDRNA2_57056_c0~~gnl/MRDRNA2_/MRDRNA2_57056_c0_seq1.p1  ORF type:complete len:140 (+),score=30.16 gnl/MRDRNA2_/MRDRNA2_57056_c0_seq1:97-516(+)